jgi:hypothetical protein
VSPDTNLLAAELRAGRPAAVRRLRAALSEARSLRAAAPALGVSIKTLQGWALRGGTRSIAAVVETVDELGMRR